MTRLENLVIHIGMPKTGSTAIQRVMGMNRAMLRDVGIAFPKAASQGDAHHPVAWAASLARVPRPDIEPLAELLAGLEQELQDGELGIISSEALFHLPMEELQPINEWVGRISSSVLVVAYVRPPASYHEGWYRQIVKNKGYSLTFPEHLQKKARVRSLHRLTDYERTFGAEKLQVRPFDRSAFPRTDVIADFCKVIGIPESVMTVPENATFNPSLDAELTEMKARMHSEGFAQSPRLERAFLEWARSRTPSRRSLFSPDSWREFRDETADEHRQLLERYGLPDDFVDEEPKEFTTKPMSDARYGQLIEELRERDATLFRDAGLGRDD